MCRGGLSAHGRVSPALNAETFPHDSADPLAAGSGRMCSIAPTGPAPHTRSRRRPPRHRGRDRDPAALTLAHRRSLPIPRSLPRATR